MSHDHDRARHQQQQEHDDLSFQQSLNIPQLIVFLLITALAIRWLISFWTGGNGEGGSSSGSSSQARTGAARRRVDERHIEQVQAMFPQYNRREIFWDLMRNGGSVQATTERILGGRGLDAVSDILTV